jgi:thiol-disulfide isomerase/thioredoxin
VKDSQKINLLCSGKMKKISFPFLFFIVFTATHAQQAVKVIKFPALEKILSPNNDTIYIINFWATWCQPCIEELPAFEQVRTNLKQEKVKFMLISLDAVKNANTNVAAFVRKKQLKSDLYLLDEPDGNTWMEKIDENWSGAIPATIFVRERQKQFVEKPLTRQELEDFINQMKKE